MPEDLNQLPGLQNQGPVDLNSLPGIMETSVGSRDNPFLQGGGKIGAPVLNFLHHATVGLTDKEIAALQASGIMGGGVGGDDFSNRYHGSLTNLRNNLAEYEGVNPAAAKGEKAAAVVAPLAIAGPEKVAQSLASASLKSGATGAGLGGAFGFGGTNDESLSQDLTATGIGAAAGGVAGTALPVGIGIAKAPFRMAKNAASVFGKEGMEAAAGRVLNQSQTAGKNAPPVLYHGTQGDFSEFKPSGSGQFGPGIYATDDPAEARRYSQATSNVGNKPTVKELQLELKNPFKVEADIGAGHPITWFQKHGFNLETDRLNTDAQRKLIDQGYDGVIAKQPQVLGVNSDGSLNLGVTTTHYVAFDKNQVRPAPAKSGLTFEPAPLPGMKLTTGQSSNDPGLLWLERSVREGSPEGAAKSATASAANNDAIRKAIGHLGDADAPNPGDAMRSSIVGKLPETSAQDQVLDLASGHLGGGASDFHSTIEQLNTGRKAAAAPLYEKAMQGGSIAPLEDQLRTELTAATGSKGQIAKQIRAIEANNPGALTARGAAGADVRAKYIDLRSQLDQAEKDRQAVLTMFQRAKTDKASNAPGAVWSPRLQNFLEDPILKQGLGKGLQIQRLEALAAGKKFNPTEIGVTGTDEQGHPIISAVPNMRVLDAGKKGLDAIVEGYRNPLTHKLELDQYGNAVNQVRASYLNEIDRLNPDYKSARAAWSGPSQSLDALYSGRNIFSSDPEFTSTRMSSLSPGDMEYYRLGVMRALSDQAKNSANGASALNTLLAKPNVQTKLTAAFGSPEGFQSFRQKAADLLNPQTDIGKAVARDNAGNFKLPNSGVADQFIRTGKGAPEAWKSYLGAISTKDASGKVTYDADGLKAAQDAFTKKFLSQVSNSGLDANGQNLVSPAKMQKFLGDYSHVINSPAFTSDQRDLIGRIAKATQMASRVQNARPPGGGSDTFQKLQGDKFIDALVGPGASKLIGVAGKLGGAAMGAIEEGKIGAMMGFVAGEKGGEMVNSLYKAPREKVINLITEAMHDPQLAKDLMMKASNTNAKLLPPPRRAKLFGVLGAQSAQPIVSAVTAPAQ